MNQISHNGRLRLWTRDYLLVVLYSLIAYIAHFMLVATLPLYVKEIGGNNITSGLVMGIYSIAALVLRPFFGKVMDRKGRKPVLVFGSILFLLGIFLQNFLHSVGMVLVLRVVQGIGFGANTTAAGTMVADLTPETRLAEGMGYYGIANPLATAIGPLVGLALVGWGGYRVLFAVSTLLVIMNLVLAYLVNYEAKQSQPGTAAAGHPDQNGRRCYKKAMSGGQPQGGSLIASGALPASGVMFFMMLAHSSILTFIPSYMILRGMPNTGNFFLVYAAVIIMTRLFVGKLADCWGTRVIVAPGIILVIVGLVILARMGSPALFWTVAILYGLGLGIVQPLLNTIAIQMSPVMRRGMANAVFNSALDIGFGIGSVLWGIVAQLSGFTLVYLAAAGCAGLALLVYMTVLNVKPGSVH